MYKNFSAKNFWASDRDFVKGGPRGLQTSRARAKQSFVTSRAQSRVASLPKGRPPVNKAQPVSHQQKKKYKRLIRYFFGFKL